MFGRLSPPLERTALYVFSDGKGMKKSRNLQEISGLFYKTVSKKAKKACTNVGQDVIDLFDFHIHVIFLSSDKNQTSFLL